MGCKPALSGMEKGQILAYEQEGLSSRGIARWTDISPFVVNRFLTIGYTYDTKKSPERPRKLTPRQERTVFRQLRADGTSLGTLGQDPGINVHKATLSRVVARTNILSYKKRKR